VTQAPPPAVDAAATVADVVRLVRETLLLPADHDVRAGHLLFYDLAFTSMDLLDLLFRIEDHFGVTISEGTVARLARGALDEAEFARDGFVTAAGRANLMALLADTPAALFPDRIAAATLPRYCTVDAIARVIDHLRAEKAAACST
jgi:acyl carrier protein